MKDEWTHKTFEDCPVCKCVTDQKAYGVNIHWECMECHTKLIKNELGTIVVGDYNSKQLSSGGIFFELPEDIHRIF